MSLFSSTKLIHWTANMATFLFGVVIVLQILLAAGILPISMAWGGRQSQLTASLRIASIIAAVLLGAFIYVIRYRAGLLGSIPMPGMIKVVSWIITAFMAFNTLGNITSISTAEKPLFGPVTFLLTAACLLVSASKSNSIGAWSSVIGILLAVAYLVALVSAAVSPAGFPPVEPYDTAISIVCLLSAPGILILFAVIHACAGEERKLFSLIGLCFSVLFCAMTSINRFVHLAVVRPSLAMGKTAGLEWFMPYGSPSLMSAIEILAWSFFLGLAFVFTALRLVKPAWSAGCSGYAWSTACSAWSQPSPR